MKNRSSKSSLFLMELIIVILFFSIASGICMQIFVKAHLLTKQTNMEQQALLTTDSVIALLKNSPGDMEQINSIYGGEKKENKVTFYLDHSFQNTNSKNASFIVEVIMQTKDQYRICVVEKKSGKELVEQSIFCHKPLKE